MVTAPLIQQGVAVDLPRTQAQTLDVKEDRLVLTLTRDQKIFLGDVELPHAELREKLAGNLRLRHDKEVYLHADRNLSYGFVVDVMATLKDAGVENLGMVTDPVQPATHP
jgi:biopolymer transport protein TolR